jgi:superfamily II DNA or RNA helicase
VRALDRLRFDVAAGAGAPLLVAPTGSGKTIIAGELARRVFDQCREAAVT